MSDLVAVARGLAGIVLAADDLVRLHRLQGADHLELLVAHRVRVRRVERVPRFIVSNACESGVTRDRPADRSVDLAPSFAEAFFAQGVTNFVCTAWPIGDVSARTFATTLYAGLLGVALDPEEGTITRDGVPKPMYLAMRDARRAAASALGGMTTWGAYQHYGDPHFRLRELEDEGRAPEPRRASDAHAEGDRAPRSARSAASDRVTGDAGTKASKKASPKKTKRSTTKSKTKSKKKSKKTQGKTPGTKTSSKKSSNKGDDTTS